MRELNRVPGLQCALFVFGWLEACCSCGAETKTIAEHEGPPRVAIHRTYGCTSSGRLGGVADYATLDVEGRLEVPADCSEEEMELAVDSERKIVAYRCVEEGKWRAIFLGREDRWAKLCDRDLGGEDEPRFSAIGSFDDEALALVRCLGGSELYQLGSFQDIGEEMRDRSDPARMTRFLFDASEVSFPRDCGDDGCRDPFLVFLATLEPDARVELQESLCPMLASETITSVRFMRAFTVCPPDVQSLAEPLLAQVEAQLISPREESMDLDLTIGQVLLQTARFRPERTGELACRFLSMDSEWYLESGDSSAALSAALMALALTPTSCPWVTEKVAQNPCNRELDCGDHLCTHGELVEEISARIEEISQPHEGSRTERVGVLPTSRAWLAAATREGELPLSMQRRNALRHYARTQPQDLPECHMTSDVGAPCRCWFGEFEDYCFTLDSADPTRTLEEPCDIYWDHENRRISRVVRSCSTAVGLCEANEDCCPGYVCDPQSNDCVRAR